VAIRPSGLTTTALGRDGADGIGLAGADDADGHGAGVIALPATDLGHEGLTRSASGCREQQEHRLPRGTQGSKGEGFTMETGKIELRSSGADG
jgi:hypothetical protein